MTASKPSASSCAATGALPDRDCRCCPRLAAFRDQNRAAFPDMFNAPVPPFGPATGAPSLLIVGLAPGLRGANFTGRPFTNDYAGDLLYPTLVKFGFARGAYGKHAKDGMTLHNCRVTNAVRCVPPENKPVGAEINNCRPFLEAEIASLKNLKTIIALGTVAHNSVLRALSLPVAAYKFGHARKHLLQPRKNARASELLLIDSYHCSRYNVNTGRLTTEMFENVIRLAQESCAD